MPETEQVAPITVYLEIGAQRTFAGAVEWPGWCRSGRDEVTALAALVAYGPRYAQVLRATALAFQPPTDVARLTVTERLSGTTTTDFGAPAVAPAADARPVDDRELARLQQILRACWAAFDAGLTAAAGRTLRTGPRGGGRDVGRLVEHVVDAEWSYLASLGWKRPARAEAPQARVAQNRQAVLDALTAAAHGELPERGPRGGLRWTPRYFVRRSAWHVLDHVWELEDRLI